MNAFLDVAERTFWTVVAAVLGSLVSGAVFDNLGIGWQDSVKIALFVGLGTLVKALLAISLDRSNGAQLGVHTVELKPDPPA